MDREQLGKISLYAITWPIFIEMSLQMLMRTTGTFMLSGISDDAVAAVGVANQILMFAMLTFNFVAMGSAVVVSQYLGARRTEDIGKLVGLSVGVNFIFGVMVSLLIVSLSGGLLGLFGLPSGLFQMSQGFLYIAGGALVVQALLSVTAAIIQSHGFTRETMVVSLGMNLLVVVGNYLFIYGPFGIPVLGVTGVAISTVVSQLIGLAVNMWILVRRVGVRFGWRDLMKWQRDHVLQILRIGVPSSAVSISYNVSQLVTTGMISSLGAMMLTTKIYTQNIMFITMIFGIAIGRGVQIIVGHLVGGGKEEDAYKQVLVNLARSMLITLAAVAVIALFRVPLIKLFTDTPEIIRIGAVLLLLGFLLEPGRNFNIILERALQAAGDPKFPMISSVLIMWLFSVPLMYILGIKLGFGIYGIWASFICDEWVRGIVLYFRWRRRGWQGKAIVSRKAEEVAV